MLKAASATIPWPFGELVDVKATVVGADRCDILTCVILEVFQCVKTPKIFQMGNDVFCDPSRVKSLPPLISDMLERFSQERSFTRVPSSGAFPSTRNWAADVGSIENVYSISNRAPCR